MEETGWVEVSLSTLVALLFPAPTLTAVHINEGEVSIYNIIKNSKIQNRKSEQKEGPRRVEHMEHSTKTMWVIQRRWKGKRSIKHT